MTISSQHIQWTVYFVGILVFGFFYFHLKELIDSNPLFVIAAVVYLLILRLSGSIIGKRWKSK